MERTSFTVTELNAHIKQLLDADMLLGNVCVTGELSNYKVYPSGHHYFTLKDAESSLRCVMFRSSAQSLRFRPASGMSVAAVGRIAVYPRDGAYQLYCTRLIPAVSAICMLLTSSSKNSCKKRDCLTAHTKNRCRSFRSGSP